ncbi:MAG: hypothetical protein OEM29_06240 [Thermoplasmata archaeon]|nr:hypothetical protein [Thermoplasmata archaeon]
MVDLSALGSEPYPETALVVGGLMALFVAAYGRRDDSVVDEIGTIVAFVIGIGVAVVCVSAALEGTIANFSLAVMALLALCLFLKPLKGVPWSGIFGLLAGAAAAYIASISLPSEVLGVEEWKVLLIIFFVVGGIVFFLTRFFEDLMAISSTVVSWKVSMVIIGLLAVVEGVVIFIEGATLTSYL